jgi:hypothetical protein
LIHRWRGVSGRRPRRRRMATWGTLTRLAAPAGLLCASPLRGVGRIASASALASCPRLRARVPP